MKKLIAAIVIVVCLSVLFALPAGAAEHTDPLAEKFDSTVGYCDMFYDSIEWYVVCKLNWEFVDASYEGAPMEVQVSAADYEAAAARYCVLTDDLLTAIRNCEDYDGNPIYNAETNTYTAFFVGGWGGFLRERVYAGYVKTGENTYDVYFEKVNYEFLSDVLPEGTTVDEFVGEEWPETVEYGGKTYANGPDGYYRLDSYGKSGIKYGVQLDGDNVLLATRTPYSVGEQPEEFDDITVESILTYEIVDGEAIITDCADTFTGSLTIPDTLGGYPVTTIAEFAFAHLTNPISVNTGNSVVTINNAAFLGCTGLESVTLGDSVRSIGSLAFEACDNLDSFAVSDNNPYFSTVDGVLFSKDATVLFAAPKTISGTYTVPAGVLTVGEYAFDGCMGLTDLVVGDNVITVGTRAFNNCMNLNTVKLGRCVTTISNYAFSNCNRMSKIIVPVSLARISDYTFYRCSSLTDVYYAGTQTQWDDIIIGSNNDPLNSVTMHYESDGSEPEDPEYLTYEIVDGEAIITGCDTSIEGSLELPATLGGYPVTEIAMNAFRFCQITDITLPETLTTIRGNAFCFSALRGIYIPAGVHTIDPVAFQGCENFNGFVVDPENPYYCNDGYGVLFNKPMTELIMAPGALQGTYTIPNGVTTVDYAAFFYCGQLAELNIPASVTNIDWNAGIFKECNNLHTITVDPQNPSYYSDERSVLYNNEKNKIYYAPKTLSGTYCVPEGVNSVNDAFEQCAVLEKLIFPESLTSIDSKFYGCKNLKTVYIPESASIFNFNLYPLVDAQTHIYYGGTQQQWDQIYMLDTNKHPDGLIVYYNSSPNDWALTWENYNGSVYITDCDESVTGSITVPDTLGGYRVVGIDPWAFQSCSGITEIRLPDSVTYIGINGFGYCSSLTRVTMSNNVTVIGQGAFIGCSSLTDVYYSGSLKQWNAIGIESENECLTGATLHCAINCDNGHSYDDTCDTTCNVCDEIRSITHTWDGGVVTKPASCKEAGEMTYTCGICGETKTETIAKLTAHAWDSGVVTKPASCKEAGVKTYTCGICGATKTETIAKLTTHTYKTTTTKATLTSNGSIVKKCSVCGNVASTTVIARPTTFTLSTVNYTCNGVVKTPGVTVKDANGKTLVKGTDYTVTYPSGRINPGTYTVTVTMKGNYSGTKTLTFNINLATPTVKASNAVDGVKITWNSIAGASNYRVYKSVYSNGAWSSWTAIKTGYTGTSYTDTTVKSGDNVKYTVRAFYGSNSSTFKASNSIKFLATPTVKASNAVNGVKLTWNSVGSAKSYIVYKSTYSGGKWSSWTRIKTGVTGTTYTDTTVKSNDNVRYTVKVINGNFTSYIKASNSIKFLATPTVKAANAAKGVTVTWNKVSGAKTYTVYRSVYSGGKWSGWTAIKTGVTGTSYTDTTVKSGATVRYTVKVINGSFTSYVKASNTTKFLTQPTVKVAKATNGIKASWAKVTGASGYIVYRRTYSGGKWGSWTAIKTTTAISYTDTTAKTGVTYQYTVRAYSGSYKSSYTNSTSIKR